MSSSRMPARRLSIAVSVLAAVTACGGAETTADPVRTTTSTAPASTVPAPTMSTMTTVAETTTAPPTTTTTITTTTIATTTTTTATGGEVISTELELLSIVAIGAGAGSGEYDITLAGRPDGLERFKVSTAGSDGACNARILDVQDTADGTVVSALTSPDPDEPCGGSTFGVAWVHVDGRRSGITYRNCSAGITPTQRC